MHAAVVLDHKWAHPEIYHQMSNLALSRAAQNTPPVADLSGPGPVLALDRFRTVLGVEDFARLALRVPPMEHEEAYSGVLWLGGLLVFGIGCGGLLVLLTVDLTKGLRAEQKGDKVV